MSAVGGGRPRQWGRALGLDADARRQGHPDNTWLLDLERGKPIATFPGRRAEDVSAWCHRDPPDVLTQVEGVVGEMAKPSFAAMHEVCGDRGHVIERLHVVQQAVEAWAAVWRAGQTQLDKDEATALKEAAQTLAEGRRPTQYRRVDRAVCMAPTFPRAT